MKKQIYIFVLCLILSLAFSQSSTFAIQNDGVVIFEPDVYEVCNGKPYHDMASRGIAFVSYNGQLILPGVPCWQCTGCYLVMGTEGDPTYPYYSNIGNYALTTAINEQINGNGAVFAAETVGYCPSSSMNGYRFRID